MNRSDDLIFRFCGAEQLDSLCAIQNEAFALLKDEQLLRRNSREMLARCLELPHRTVGVFDGEEMAAFGVLYIGGDTEDNLGRSAGLDEDAIRRTANFKLVIVRPAYRGRGLQQAIAKALETEAAALGYEHICATASPYNLHSCRNFDALGYERRGTVTAYGGLERVVFHKKLV